MAQVPDVAGPKLVPTGPDAPQINVRGASPEAFGSGIAAAGARLGGQLSEVADSYTAHAVQMQAIDNRTRVADARNASILQMQRVANDYKMNQLGGNAKPNWEGYIKQLETARSAAGKDLTPFQQQQYNTATQGDYNDFIGTMSTHQATQQNKFVDDTAVASMDVARNLAVANSEDPTYLSKAKDTIATTGAFMAMRHGMGREVGVAMIQKQMSRLYSDVTKKKMVEDPVNAEVFFKAHEDEMVGDDISELTAMLKPRTDAYIARSVGTAFAAGDFSGGGGPKAAVITEVLKDPNKFFASIAGGNVVVYGERTHAKQQQLLADWEKGGRKGVKPADSSYHEAKNGKGFDVHPAPGQTVAELFAKMKATDLSPTELIAEPHKNHVHIAWSNKDLGKLQGGGKRGPSIATAGTIEELEVANDAALTAVGPYVKQNFGSDPRMEDALRADINTSYQQRRTILNMRTDAALGTVTAALIPDDGSLGPTTPDALMRQPGVSEAWKFLSESQRDTALKQTMRNGNPPLSQLTASQLEAQRILDGESQAKPDVFAQRSPLTDPLYNELPNSYRIQFSNRRNTILAGKQVNQITASALTMAAPLLKGSEVENTAENADNYSKFSSALSNQVKLYYNEHKKAPDLQWVRDRTTELLGDKAIWGGTEHTLTTEAYRAANFVPAWAVKEILAQDPTLTPSQVTRIYQRRLERVR